jgi:superfamily II DNA or RNA helicase
MDVGEYSGDIKDINHQHIVTTWQALKNNPELLYGINMFIIDECHGIKDFNVLFNLLSNYGKNIQFRYGVTATFPLEELEVLAIKINTGGVKYKKPADELMREGYLATIKINVMQLVEPLVEQFNDYKQEGGELTYKQFKKNYFPDFKSEMDFLKNSENRNRFIVEHIKELSKKGNVLILFGGISYGKKLSSMIENSYFVYGKDKSKERKKVYDLFETENNLVVFANWQIASTGLNIKSLDILVYIDMGKNNIKIMQSIGRSTRKTATKVSAEIWDICSDFKFSSSHKNERIGIYKKANYEFNVEKIDYSP